MDGAQNLPFDEAQNVENEFLWCWSYEPQSTEKKVCK